MAVLTIDGIEVPVRYGSPELAPKRVGEVDMRSVTGNLVRDERAVKDRWALRTLILTKDEFSALFLILENTPPFLTVAGELVGGTVTCDATDIEAEDYMHEGRTLSFVLEEV